MFSHSLLFILSIVLFLGNIIFSQLFQRNLESSTENIITDIQVAMFKHEPLTEEVKPIRICREYVTDATFRCLTSVASTATLILFTYMSVKFSKPITSYWKERVHRAYSTASSSL